MEEKESKGFWRYSWEYLSEVRYFLVVPLLFVAWVALLSFPWGWVVPAVAILESVLLVIVVAAEYSARSVNGAGGWMTFGYMLGHAWFFLGAGVLRLIVGLWQLLM